MLRTRNETLAWIDTLRGVAVVLVIASHAMPVLAGLPWAVKRFSNMGFFGVQLFFVVSSFTLARSWRAHEVSGRPGLVDFALRRVFRIVPAFFLAALLYARILPHRPLDLERLVTFATFSSGWSPAQMPTVPGAWVGVPGGWSIAVEMMFYALFPALICMVRGVGPAVAATLLSLPLAWIANASARAVYTPVYGSVATEQFLFYWLPNQLPVFLVGLVVFETSLRAGSGRAWAACGAWLGHHAAAVLALSIALFLALAWVPIPRLPEPGWALIDSPMLAAVAFGGAVLALRFGRLGWAALPVLTGLGQASFSAYLLHFAVIEAVRAVLPARVAGFVGVPACLASLCLFGCVLVATAGLSQVTYRMIELPAIRLGGRMARRCGVAGRPEFAKN